MKKTICFVTHDINEAIKMGDRIAIFSAGQLVQYGTPQEILSKPANDFVSDFIGLDRVVKMLSLFHVEDVVRRTVCTAGKNELPNVAVKMRDLGADTCFLLDNAGQAVGFITLDDIAKHDDSAAPEIMQQIAAGRKQAFVQELVLLRDALSLMLDLDTEHLGVMDGNRITGAISLRDIRKHASKKEGD